MKNNIVAIIVFLLIIQCCTLSIYKSEDYIYHLGLFESESEGDWLGIIEEGKIAFFKHNPEKAGEIAWEKIYTEKILNMTTGHLDKEGNSFVVGTSEQHYGQGDVLLYTFTGESKTPVKKVIYEDKAVGNMEKIHSNLLDLGLNVSYCTTTYGSDSSTTAIRIFNNNIVFVDRCGFVRVFDTVGSTLWTQHMLTQEELSQLSHMSCSFHPRIALDNNMILVTSDIDQSGLKGWSRCKIISFDWKGNKLWEKTEEESCYDSYPGIDGNYVGFSIGKKLYILNKEGNLVSEILPDTSIDSFHMKNNEIVFWEDNSYKGYHRLKVYDYSGNELNSKETVSIWIQLDGDPKLMDKTIVSCSNPLKIFDKELNFLVNESMEQMLMDCSVGKKFIAYSMKNSRMMHEREYVKVFGIGEFLVTPTPTATPPTPESTVITKANVTTAPVEAQLKNGQQESPVKPKSKNKKIMESMQKNGEIIIALVSGIGALGYYLHILKRKTIGEELVEVKRGVEREGALIKLGIKIVNKSTFPIRDVDVKISAPEAFRFETGSNIVSLGDIEQGDFQSAIFRLTPTRCVDGTITGIVTYKNVKGKLQSLEIKETKACSICPMLEPVQVSEEEFKSKTNSYTKNADTFTSSHSYLHILDNIKQRCASLHTIFSNFDSDGNGKALYFAKGKYSQQNIGTEIKLSGSQDKKTIHITVYAEDAAMGTGLLSELREMLK